MDLPKSPESAVLITPLAAAETTPKDTVDDTKLVDTGRVGPPVAEEVGRLETVASGRRARTSESKRPKLEDITPALGASQSTPPSLGPLPQTMSADDLTHVPEVKQAQQVSSPSPHPKPAQQVQQASSPPPQPKPEVKQSQQPPQLKPETKELKITTQRGDVISASAPAVTPDTVKMPTDRFKGQSEKLLRQSRLAVGSKDALGEFDLFVECWKELSSEDQKTDFRIFYNTYREKVLSGGPSTWLKADVIWYFNPTERADEDPIVMIGDIYLNAVKMSADKEEKLKKQPQHARASASELILPYTILVHMYRLFEDLEEVTEAKAKISAIVIDLEKKLRINVDKKPITASNTTPSSGSMLSAGAVGGIVAVTGDIMGQDIVKRKMAELEEKMRGVKDPGQAIQAILNIVADPGFSKVIGDSVQKFIPGMADGNFKKSS